jgi:phospholipase C
MHIRLPSAALLAGAAGLVGLGVGLSVPAVASSPAPSTTAHTPGPPGPFPHMNHVFVIMMENTSYADLLNAANPNTAYIQQLANTYGLETKYYGVTHTSLPNYVAVTSGSTWGSTSDDEAQADNGDFSHESLFDEMQRAGVSSKGYMESMPSVGYTGNYGDCVNGTVPDPDCSAGTDTGTALYVRKHNPFMQYQDIVTNPQRADQVVPLSYLTSDLKSGNVAQFVWITPNICDDMHGGAPSCPYPSSPTDPAQATLFQDGNNFLQTWVTAIMRSPAWNGNSAIFVMWDEGGYEDTSPYGPEDDSGCCDSPILPATPTNPATGSGGDLAGGTLYGGGHVPMIVIARSGSRSEADATPTNHYSLLKTIEMNWNLPLLGYASDSLDVPSLAPLLEPSKKH